MTENQITGAIIGSAIDIHRALGPGLLESVYEKLLFHELIERGLKVERQVSISLSYKDYFFTDAFRADLIVEDRIIVELKSVEHLHNVHYKQLLTYLKLTDNNLGLLINFNVDYLKSGIKRVVNNFDERLA